MHHLINKNGEKTRQLREDPIYEKIKKDVFLRRIRPNMQLVEETIAKEMGVSRTPVRSALKRLAFEGLVDIIPYKGVYVADPNADDVQKLFDVRIALEGMATLLAASNANLDEHYFYELLNQEMQSYRDRNLEDFIRINDEIHLAIAGLSQNPFLERCIYDLIIRTNVYLVFYDPFYSSPLQEVKSPREHYKIIGHLINGNPGRCKEAMTEHLISTLSGLNIELMKGVGGSF